MKYLRAILLLPFIFAAQPALAANDSLIPADVENYLGYGIIFTALILFLVVLLVLLRTFKVLTKLVLKAEGYTDEQIAAEMKPAKKEKKAKEEVWLKLLSLKPMAQEKELLIAHEYDGIQELNNPTPAWFMWLFYGTIAFAVCYLLTYHVFGFGQLQYEE